MDKSKDDKTLKTYRPWNTSLEDTIKTNNTSIEFQEESNQEKDIKGELIPQLEELYLNDSSKDENDFDGDYNLSGNLDLIKDKIEHQLETKLREINNIEQTLNNSDNSKLLIGGFFKPVINTPTISAQGKKVTHLVKELQKKEYEIQVITNNLKTVRALEHAESAEALKNQEIEKRIELESKLQSTIKDFTDIKERLENEKKFLENKLVSQENNLMKISQEFKELQYQHNSTCELNKKLENDLKSYKSKTNDLNYQLLNIEQQLNSTKQSESELIKFKNNASEKIKLLDNELNLHKETIANQDSQLKELTKDLEDKNSLVPKLENIIDKEQELRISFENKVKDLNSKLEQEQNQKVAIELQLQEISEELDKESKLRKDLENKVKKLTEELNQEREKMQAVKEKAKAAINQANSAVLELLGTKSIDLDND